MADNRRIIPFGPQHPVLPEPIQLQLVLDEEKVVEVVPGLGYVHRGLEKLVKIPPVAAQAPTATTSLGSAICS